MSDHDSWRDLLDAASAPGPDAAAPSTDPRADLRRGRLALRRRRVRQARLGGMGLAAAVLVGGVLLQGLGGSDTAPGDVAAPPPTQTPSSGPSPEPSSGTSPEPSSGPSSGPPSEPFAASPPAEARSIPAEPRIRLLAQRLEAGPFAFGRTPAGWATQGQSRFAATIAPTDGSVSADPRDYIGKITVTMASPDQPVRPPGSRTVRLEGRAFVVSPTADGGATWVTTPTQPSEPPGRVMVQFWEGSGWDEESMVAFTATVRVVGDVVTPVG